MFACLVTQEADLPAIRAAVDKHNALFDPELDQREVEDEHGKAFAITGDNQVREPRS